MDALSKSILRVLTGHEVPSIITRRLSLRVDLVQMGLAPEVVAVFLRRDFRIHSLGLGLNSGVFDETIFRSLVGFVRSGWSLVSLKTISWTLGSRCKL